MAARLPLVQKRASGYPEELPTTDTLTVSNAAAGTDALNRATGDGRYGQLAVANRWFADNRFDTHVGISGAPLAHSILSMGTNVGANAGATHFNLYDGGTGSALNAYGFGLTSGTFNYNVPSGSKHSLNINGVAGFTMDAAGVVVTGAFGATAFSGTTAAFSSTLTAAGSVALGASTIFGYSILRVGNNVVGADQGATHVALFGGGTSISSYGFGVTSATLNSNVPTGAVHSFNVNGVSQATIGASRASFAVPVKLPSYTVAGLPAGQAGDMAFASNGRAVTGATGATTIAVEGAGGGTGCVVSHNGTAWKVAGTNVTVSA